MGDVLSIPLHVRALREESREIDVVASTDAIDRYGEILEQNWQLDAFRLNPVILWSHKKSELTIGQATRIEVVDGRLEATIKFATAAANPLAENVWQSFREKTLRAVSVGFIPHSYRWEKRGDREVLVLDDNELVEISPTPIPANPEALAKMKARAMADAKNVPPAERGAAATSNPETDMGIEQENAALKATVAEKDAKLTGVEKALADEQTKSKALAADLDTRTAERDAANKRADEAEHALVEREVDSLVGKKISAAERDDMVKLAKVDKALFDSLIAKRSDLPTAKEDGSVLSSEAAPTTTARKPRGKGLGDLARENVKE